MQGILSDGRKFEAREVLTKDLVRAQREAGVKRAELIPYYLVANAVTVEGAPLAFEDVMELRITDFNLLMQAINGEGEPSGPADDLSSPSPTQRGGGFGKSKG